MRYYLDYYLALSFLSVSFFPYNFQNFDYQGHDVGPNICTVFQKIFRFLVLYQQLHTNLPRITVPLSQLLAPYPQDLNKYSPKVDHLQRQRQKIFTRFII